MAELLNLSTVVERDTIAIDGESYEILNQKDLGLWEFAVVQSKAELVRGIDLTSDERPTPAQERENLKALRELVKILVPSLEEKVLNKLGQIALLAIYGTFMNRLESSTSGGEGEGNPPSRRTTGG